MYNLNSRCYFIFFFLHFYAVAAATDFQISVVTQASIDLPQPPFLVAWCEGKNCEHLYSKKVACSTDVFDQANLNSKKIGFLVAGETLETRVYYTKILKLGSYLPLEGGTRTLVSRTQGNTWVSFYDHAWDSEMNPKDQVTFPETEAWALVKTKTGLTGFVKMQGSQVPACPFQVSK